jgi:phosphomannomutase/phosphoglucomutase
VNRLFGTDGVRGLVGSELNPLFIARLAHAIGSYFGEGSRILIGSDYRYGNDAIKRIVEGSLLLAGLKVYDAGYAPTPCDTVRCKESGL